MGSALALPALLVLALQAPVVHAQQPQPAGPGRQPPGPGILGGRGGPPQPQQQQGLDYFLGVWTFAYTGRDSPVSQGPRTGTMTFERNASGNVLEVKTEGQVEGAGPFKDTGTFEWNGSDKVMTISERLMNGTEIVSIGNWSSPLTIRAESRPVRVGGQSVRIRRVYSIVSAQSFTVTEELSVDGGPFQRLGAGQFSKVR